MATDYDGTYAMDVGLHAQLTCVTRTGRTKSYLALVLEDAAGLSRMKWTMKPDQILELAEFLLDAAADIDRAGGL